MSDDEALAAVAAMHRTGAEVREREVRRAIRELGDDLDAEERAALERLGRRLIERVLASPTAGLLAGDDDRVETALELFGEAPDRPTRTGRTGGPDGEGSDPDDGLRAGD